MDSGGRGKGVLLSGSDPTPVGPVAQALEPIYTWGNTRDGSGVPLVSDGVAVEGVHMLNCGQGSSCTCTPYCLPGYTPYTYPHPLVSGGSSPAAPLVLRKHQH